MSILVVDENDVTRRLVVGVLNNRGYETMEAANGEEAAAMLVKGPRVMVVGEDVDRTRLTFPRMLLLQQPLLPEKLISGVEGLLNGKSAAGCGMSRNEDFMKRAIDLSQEKMDQNCGGPFGAVIVKDGEIIAEGWNQVTSTNDPTAHAEMVAIRNACAAIGDFTLDGCEIYTSCEPCPMCLAAIYWARIDRIYFANTREDAEKIGFDDDFIYREFRVDDHKRTLPAKEIMRTEAQVVFENWMAKQDKTAY